MAKVVYCGECREMETVRIRGPRSRYGRFTTVHSHHCDKTPAPCLDFTEEELEAMKIRFREE